MLGLAAIALGLTRAGVEPRVLTWIASLALAAYFIVPTIAAGLTSAKLASMGRMTPSLWRGIVGMPVFYVIHGLGAVCSAIMLLVRASLNLPVPKYKTER